jgi:hypothetical protein
MKLIEDLGMRLVGTQGRRYKFGLYECPSCLKHFEVATSDVNRGSTTKCSGCAWKAQATKAGLTVISRFKEVHGGSYSYERVNYVNSRAKVSITCPVHGEFLQTPKKHLGGQGCPKCVIAAKVAEAKATVIWRFMVVHGDKYEYSLVNYVHSKAKVQITCQTHGEFLQTPNAHLKGAGCPKCAEYGFQRTKPGVLYYLKITTADQVLYKIGITNRTVQERYQIKDLDIATILFTKYFESGEDCYNEEQRILKEFYEFRYIGLPVLSSGNTEMFVKDILPSPPSL